MKNGTHVVYVIESRRVAETLHNEPDKPITSMATLDRVKAAITTERTTLGRRGVIGIRRTRPMSDIMWDTKTFRDGPKWSCDLVVKHCPKVARP